MSLQVARHALAEHLVPTTVEASESRGLSNAAILACSFLAALSVSTVTETTIDEHVTYDGLEHMQWTAALFTSHWIIFLALREISRHFRTKAADQNKKGD